MNFFLLPAVAVLAALLLVCPGKAQADGGFVSPPEYIMYEPAQRAFLDYDHESGTEQLSILPSFHGDAHTFAWIIPVPGLPEVALADRQLFRDLDTLTRPEYRSRDGDWDCFTRNEDIYQPDTAADGFQIITSGLVGYYQTLVLSATEAADLLAFLTDLGFLHDGNRETATAAINDYVQRSWYFVAMQVDSTALAEINPYYHEGYYGYYSGNLEPIELTFAADDIIYPMKISALSAAEDSRVLLYVKSDHRMTFAGASATYANRFSSGEIEQIAYHASLREVILPGDFLTRLERGYRPAQMTEDIVLERAPTDEEFRLIHYSGFPWTGALLLSLPVAVAVKRRFWIRRG
jgi:hypothetical protein